MERGTVSAGRDPASGQNRYPPFELVRLTVPRRVYTQAHMDVTAESVAAVYETRHQVRGLRFTYEPDMLRFFQARFEPVDVPITSGDMNSHGAGRENAAQSVTAS
jgi:tyrosine phenol-lyase